MQKSTLPPNVNKRGAWAYFYKNYLLAGSDIFQDPDGTPYNLSVVYCGTSGIYNDPDNGTAAGENCKAAAQRYSSTFAAQDHTILVVLGAKCDGEATVASYGYIKNNRSVRAIIFIKLH